MKTIRYTRQPDSYGCGPTAILNALKWAGAKATLKTHYRPLVTRCRAKDPDGHEFSGTTHNNFQNALKYVSQKHFKVKHLSFPTVKQIAQELDSGKAVILLHFNKGDSDAHFTLIIGNNKDEFTVVNAFQGCKTVANVSHKIMKFWIKRKDGLPMAWVLEKHTV